MDVQKDLDGRSSEVPLATRVKREGSSSGSAERVGAAPGAGHGFHHEGYDDTGSRLRFYESDRELELHKPYLFMAATNPSGIDVSCAALRAE
jgi:hypothetical protein